jgi:hypothetical protein
VFHKILKSGCRAEESKLRTAQRLTNLLSVFCILSWRVFWMTILKVQPGRYPRREYLTKSEAPDDVVAVARALMGWSGASEKLILYSRHARAHTRTAE